MTAKEMFRKLEVDFLANKSENLYFCLLGDCKESNLEQENYDREVIKEGLEEVQRLNQKYENNEFPIFIEKENGMTKKVHIWAGKEKEEH